MTRFARAKGSKSSNERKPEEATSWSELKNAMLLKNKKQPEPVEPKEVIKEEKTEKNVEWAPLGDDFSKSISLIKQHMSKKVKNNETTISEEVVKKKLGKKVKNKISEEKVKRKGKEISDGQELEPNVEKKLKKGKKRKADNVGDENVQKKKKIEKNLKEEEKGDKNDAKSPKLMKLEKKGKKFEKNKKLKKKFEKKQVSQERNSIIDEIIVNGEKIPIVKFQGFQVTLEDAEKLKKLRNELKKEGIPRSKLEAAIKLERRRAEKALSRLKKAVCFLCRGHGHLLSNCPNLKEKQNTGTGICYKCGSTEHTAMECKVVRDTSFQFAECFICKEQGHIARQCPDNPRGLYPNGGACRECGDVTHLRKDCPKVLTKKAEEEITVGIRSDRDLECLDEEIINMEKKKKKKVKKNPAIKF